MRIVVVYQSVDGIGGEACMCSIDRSIETMLN